MAKFSQPAGNKRVNTFIAGFDSDCWTCGGDIFEGDTAGYLPGEPEPSCPDCVREHSEE